MKLVGAAAIACYSNIVHPGGEGEAFVGNFIGYIGSGKPGCVCNPRIGLFLLEIVLKKLPEKAKVVIQPDAVPVEPRVAMESRKQAARRPRPPFPREGSGSSSSRAPRDLPQDARMDFTSS